MQLVLNFYRGSLLKVGLESQKSLGLALLKTAGNGETLRKELLHFWLNLRNCIMLGGIMYLLVSLFGD